MTTATGSLDEDVTIWLTPGHPDRGRLIEDPYPLFDRLRDEAPVYKSQPGPWFVTRLPDVLQSLREPGFSRDASRAMNRHLGSASGDEPLSEDAAERLFETWMLYRDPPAHERLRRMMNKAFLPKSIERWSARAEEIALEILAPLRDEAEFDLLDRYAAQLPLRIICEMIGMPSDRAADLAAWSHTIVMLQEPGERTPQFDAQAKSSLVECFAYFRELVAEKRRHPGDDIISILLESEHAEANPATDREIVGSCILLNVAGQETTMHRISNGTLYLLDNPDQYRALRNDLSLMPNAIEEILRYSSVNALPRYATRDVRFGDHVIPEGDIVLPVLGAANRDPGYFDDPHNFDIRRSNARDHLTFGNGIHYCLGVHLARLEANTALTVLNRDAPELELVDDTPRWRDTFTARSLQRMPVRWAG